MPYRDIQRLTPPSAAHAFTVTILLEFTLILYFVSPDVPEGSIGILCRYAASGVVKSTQSPSPTTLHPMDESAHPVTAVPNCFSTIPAVSPAGKLPLVSTKYSCTAVRMESISVSLRSSLASRIRFGGLSATNTVTAKTEIITMTTRSSIRVNPPRLAIRSRLASIRRSGREANPFSRNSRTFWINLFFFIASILVPSLSGNGKICSAFCSTCSNCHNVICVDLHCVLGKCS